MSHSIVNQYSLNKDKCGPICSGNVGIKNSDIPTINCELKYLEIIGAKII